MSRATNKNFFSWLLSPKVILLSLILGVLYGYFLKAYLDILEPVGKIFLALLEMCVIPLIISAITSSFARLIKSYKTHRNKQILFLPLYFILGMVITSLAGIVAAHIGHIGKNIDHNTRALLGQALLKASQHFETSKHAIPTHQHKDLLDLIITDNLIKAAAFDKTIPLLMFSVLLGLSLGFITSRTGETALQVVDGIFEALLKLVNGIIYLLPIGLFCLIAQQTAYLSIDILSPLASLITFFCALGLITIIICLVITAIKTKHSVWSTILKLREALTIALASSSSFSALPFALSSLEEKFKLNRDDVNIILPLGLSLNFIGATLFFSSVTIFMLGFYGHAITLNTYFITVIGSMLTALAIGSLPAIAGFSLISIMFTPLGLPVKSTVVILVLISQVIDPVMTVVNVCGNVMITALLSRAEP